MTRTFEPITTTSDPNDPNHMLVVIEGVDHYVKQFELVIDDDLGPYVVGRLAPVPGATS